MKNNLKIYFHAFASVFMLMMASACTDMIFESGNDLPDTGREEPAGEKLYAAFRVYNAAEIGESSRADFDSDGGNYNYPEGEGGKTFDKGLADENAIYTGYSGEEDSPHFLLVFDGTESEPGDLKKILPLINWDKEVEENKYPTVKNTYYTFYTLEDEDKIPGNFKDLPVLIVLNASAKLRNELKVSVDKLSYSDVLEMTVKKAPVPATRDDVEDEEEDIPGGASVKEPSEIDFLFFEDEENDKSYFTMTSSMVIPSQDFAGEAIEEKVYQPSIIRRDFYWYPSKERAIGAPIFSFFVERMQSKYTVLFNIGENSDYDTNQQYVYFGEDDPYNTDVYKPKSRIVFEAWKNFFPYEDADNGTRSKEVEFKYITEYRRSPSMTEPTPLQIRKTKNWKINIVGWSLNALEKEEYLFKKLSPGINYYDNWNIGSLSPYRNFWAEGKDYTGGSYPDQYRTSDNQKTIFDSSNPNYNVTFKSLETLSNNSLNYLPYNKLTQRYIHQYASEHTLGNPSDVYTPGIDPIATNEHLRRNTHIIIGAQFLLGPGTKDAKGDSYDGFDPESVYYSNNLFDAEGLMIGKAPDNTNIDASCKLYMNDIFWSETAYKAYVVEYLGYLLLDDKIKNELDDLVENGKYNDGVIYVSSESNATEPGPATGSYFELGHIKMEKGDNMVYVKPNEEVYLYIKNTAWDPEKEVTWTDEEGQEHKNNKEFIQLPKVEGREFFEKLSLKQREYFAQHFKSGRMYYAIPITHDKNQLGTNEISIGKFGSVRNHWYNFKIKNINNLGVAVDRPEEPIVPNNLPKHEGLGVEMTVLPWHTISTDVDISGQRPPLSPDEIDLDLKLLLDDWNYQGKKEELK